MFAIFQNNETTQNMMSFESSRFEELDNLRTHPRRVAKKETSVEGTVRPMILVLADIMAFGRHSHYSPFLNPQLHERRPSPQRFYRQKKSFQAAYHGSYFARYLCSKRRTYNGIVTRHPFFAIEMSASCGTSV